MPILFITVVIDLIGFGIVIPILPFMSPQFGADKLDIALIVSVYAMCAGLMGPFWGRLSDRWGRKPVIMICLSGAALSYVFLGLATELWMIYAARAFAGVMAGNIGVASAMIADITPPEHRARGMGMIGAAFGLGVVIGPTLGGLLAGSDGSFTLPCLVAGCMSFMAIVATYLFLPESLDSHKRASNREHQRSGPRQSILAMLRETHNTLLVAQFALHSICLSGVTYLFPLWVGDNLGWGPREVGIVFGVQGVIMAVLQGAMIGPIVRRFGELPFLRTGLFFMVLGLLICVFADSTVTILAGVFIASSGGTIGPAILNALTSHRTPVPIRGRMMGTTGSTSAWGRVIGPLGCGVLLQTFGYAWAWMFMVFIGCLFLAWAVSQRPQHYEGPQSPLP
jgi:MFS family permease